MLVILLFNIIRLKTYMHENSGPESITLSFKIDYFLNLFNENIIQKNLTVNLNFFYYLKNIPFFKQPPTSKFWILVIFRMLQLRLMLKIYYKIEMRKA